MDNDGKLIGVPTRIFSNKEGQSVDCRRLADTNGDGKIDVLFNHGDSVDLPSVLRPYHGVSWLENKGTFPFKYHRLAHFPGAHTSVPADLDGNGRLGVVSTAFIPTFRPGNPGRYWQKDGCESVIWLRQTEPGRFQRYWIEMNAPFHPCAEAGGIDGDGDVDLNDLTALLSSFGTCAGQAGFNPGADFDASGCVTLADLAILLSGFGQ